MRTGPSRQRKDQSRIQVAQLSQGVGRDLTLSAIAVQNLPPSERPAMQGEITTADLPLNSGKRQLL